MSHYLCREMGAEVACQVVLWVVSHVAHLWCLEGSADFSDGQRDKASCLGSIWGSKEEGGDHFAGHKSAMMV